MRRQLALLSLATTALVVIALLIPLGLLVRQQASDRARADGERRAQSIASLIALAVTLDVDPDSIDAALGSLRDGEIVVLNDRSTIGTALPGQGAMVDEAFASQATVAMLVDAGWEMALPVIGREEVVVVDVLVTTAELSNGVTEAWVLLAILGVVLVVAAVLVADRLGAGLVKPIGELAAAAHRMGEGDLTVRIAPGEPEEVREVGEAFNHLAGRLSHLLAEEREAVADLSHRLRTPLTSLRLQAEKVSDPVDRTAVISQVDRLEHSIDQLILATRAGQSSETVERCNLDDVVLDRAAFWQVLADEQDREMTVNVGASGVELAIAAETVGTVIDVLVGNVFAHTEAGTALSIGTGESGNRPWLEVSDHGAGFGDESLLGRGMSGRGSTGLGLDIARRAAETTGGEIEIVTRPNGGARVRVWFG